jgi:hypothetical protein
VTNITRFAKLPETAGNLSAFIDSDWLNYSPAPDRVRRIPTYNPAGGNCARAT